MIFSGFTYRRIHGPREKSDSCLLNIIIQVIVALIVAFLIGEGSVFHDRSAIHIVGDLRKTIQAYRDRTVITVENNLLVPVELYIDNISVYFLGPEQSVRLLIPSESKMLSFSNRSKFTPSDVIEGYFSYEIQKDNKYTINVLEKQQYFYLK